MNYKLDNFNILSIQVTHINPSTVLGGFYFFYNSYLYTLPTSKPQPPP